MRNHWIRWYPGLGQIEEFNTMPEIHIPHWVQIVVHATQENTERITTHNFESATDIGDPVTATQLAAAFWTAVETSYKAAVSNLCNFDYVEVKTLYPTPPNYSGIYYIPQPAPGTQTGDASPGNVSLGIRWKTGVRGRKFRGRNNVFGMSEAMSIGSTFNAAEVLNAVALAADIWQFSGGLGVTLSPVVASRTGLFLTRVLGWTIDYLVDSQRTRLLQRGN